MKKCRIVLLLCCVCYGCAVKAPHYRALEGSIVRENLIAVEYFDMAHAENSYEGKSDFSKILAEYLAGALQEKDFAAAAVADDAQMPGKYRISGEITRIDQGNWGKRFLIGPGPRVGMARISAQAVLTRAGDGRPVARAEKAFSSSSWRGRESILRSICAKISRGMADEFHDALGKPGF